MILLKNIEKLICDSNTILTDVDLLSENGKITQIGKELKFQEGVEVIDCAGCAVFPGFVNAHTHLYQMLLVGQRDDLTLQDWCNEVLGTTVTALYSKIPIKERERFSYYWTAAGICEMLKCGITAFVDMDLNFGQDGIYKAINDSGVKGYVGIELADLFLSDEQGLKRDLAEIERLLKTYPGNTVLTPSEVNLCSAKALEEIAKLNKNHLLRVQIHVNETAREASQCLYERGKAELSILNGYGLLSRFFSAAHFIYYDEDELELADDNGISIVYNPKSNMKLGSGICPIRKLLDAGINIALGTDGPASNDRLDMFEEMRSGLLLQRASEKEADILSSAQMFKMATLGGAYLLGINAGALNVGKAADFCVMPLEKPHLGYGSGDIFATLVHCAIASDIRDVFVNGKAVVIDGKVQCLNEDEIKKEFSEIVKRMRVEEQNVRKS